MRRPKTKLGTAAFMSVVFILGMMFMAALGEEQAQAHHNAWRWKGPVTATWYGPGYYNHTFACAGKRAPDGTLLPTTYRYHVRGVAVNSSFLPCGAKVTMRNGHRIIRARVIDRCPGCDTRYHPFDLTQQSMFDLCGCHHTLTRVYWYRGWYA